MEESKINNSKALPEDHKHKFSAAIAFDWQGNATEYGVCKELILNRICGETDI